jgi:hypothetical protein
MNLEELKELINIEFVNLDLILKSINELTLIIGDSQPDKFQLAAISKFLSDIYNGTENVLKRLCKYLKIPLPIGGFFHTELLMLFRTSSTETIPVLFDDTIFEDFKALMKFRHYVIHGYAFQLNWNIIVNSVKSVDVILNHFKLNVLNYLTTLQK